jgi:hypothetical protein
VTAVYVHACVYVLHGTVPVRVRRPYHAYDAKSRMLTHVLYSTLRLPYVLAESFFFIFADCKVYIIIGEMKYSTHFLLLGVARPICTPFSLRPPMGCSFLVCLYIEQ